MMTRSLNHSTYQLQYHVVWGTKYRRRWLKDYVRRELMASLKATTKKCPALHLIAVNTDEDHVHLQMEIPPSIAVADAVRSLKAESCAWIRKRFPFIRRIYVGKDGIWSVGYFVSSVGIDEERVRKYIEWQGKKDLPQTARLF